MALTKFIYKKDSSHSEDNFNEGGENEKDQILHLKRLLVTLKQHYEKIIQQNHTQIQDNEAVQKKLKEELIHSQQQLILVQSIQEEEVQALRNQQVALKELLRQSQEALQQVPPFILQGSHAELRDSLQKIEQLERLISHLREKTDEANLETKQLREQLTKQQKINQESEQLIERQKQQAQEQINQLKHQLILNKQQEEGIETVVSETSSHHLKQELEGIKRTLVQGAQETKAIETRYVEVLNEKIALEYQSKQLLIQLDNHSANLASAHAQIQEMESQKYIHESLIKQQQENLAFHLQKEEGLKRHILQLEESLTEKELMHDKYEQLKEEWEKISEQLDETLDLRGKAEKQLIDLKEMSQENEQNLQNCYREIDQLLHSKQQLEGQVEQLHTLLEESEGRLKTAQQHLAKKVKESALLNEKLEEQQSYLFDLNQTVEIQRNQLSQFQANADLYQKQENQLKEQLKEGLKNSEIQIEKWEKKYFQMADKWQESESRARDLKKFEEKHHQLQTLLSNLGSFIGKKELIEELPVLPETTLKSDVSKEKEEKYDLFGMKQESSDKYKTHLLS